MVRKLVGAGLAAALAGFFAASAAAQDARDWVAIKDPKELRALYSDKTFRGNGWIGHYRADQRLADGAAWSGAR